VILILCVSLLLMVIHLNSRLKTMQEMLKQLTTQPIPPDHPINDELKQLLKEGSDVKAVKRAREVFGLSLLEAKQYIDQLKGGI
jgi:ribosomal protein L7/L12